MVAYLTWLENLLIHKGYWIRSLSTTIVLTDADREALNEPYLPDPQIKVLGYSLRRTELLWVDAQQTGRGAATIAAFAGHDSENASKFRLFTDHQYRELVSRRLIEQMVQSESVLRGVIIRFALYASIDPPSEGELEKRFQEKNGCCWMRARTMGRD